MRQTYFKARRRTAPCLRIGSVLLGAALVSYAVPSVGQTSAAASEPALCAAYEKYIELSFSTTVDDAITSAILRDLAAELAERKIAVCRPGRVNRAPLSRVLVSRQGADVVSIEVIDSLTKKRVGRDIELEQSDKNTNALVIAVAVDELLRATWAELSLTHDRALPPSPQETAPAEASATDEASSPPRHRLGVGVALDYYIEGTPLWGVDLDYGITLVRWLDLSFSVGPRFSGQKIELETANDTQSSGRIQARAVQFAATLAVPLVQGKHLHFGPQLSATGAYAWFEGRTDAPFDGGTHRGFVAQLSGGIFIRYHFRRLFLQAQSEWGAPIRALEVTDGSDRIGGLVGVVSANRIYLGLTFP